MNKDQLSIRKLTYTVVGDEKDPVEAALVKSLMSMLDLATKQASACKGARALLWAAQGEYDQAKHKLNQHLNHMRSLCELLEQVGPYDKDDLLYTWEMYFEIDKYEERKPVIVTRETDDGFRAEINPGGGAKLIYIDPAHDSGEVIKSLLAFVPIKAISRDHSWLQVKFDTATRSWLHAYEETNHDCGTSRLLVIFEWNGEDGTHHEVNL